MRRIFADTGYWIAIVDQRDAMSKIARRLAPELAQATLVTSDLVFTEFLNAMSTYGVNARAGAVRLLRNAQADSHIEVIECSREHWSKSVDLYERRADKPWSLTDCSSFLLMDRTGDSDFEQAGFVALLKQR
jgi:predicted nucleic acid-binding protein